MHLMRRYTSHFNFLRHILQDVLSKLVFVTSWDGDFDDELNTCALDTTAFENILN